MRNHRLRDLKNISTFYKWASLEIHIWVVELKKTHTHTHRKVKIKNIRLMVTFARREEVVTRMGHVNRVQIKFYFSTRVVTRAFVHLTIIHSSKHLFSLVLWFFNLFIIQIYLFQKGKETHTFEITPFFSIQCKDNPE